MNEEEKKSIEKSAILRTLEAAKKIITDYSHKCDDPYVCGCYEVQNYFISELQNLKHSLISGDEEGE